MAFSWFKDRRRKDLLAEPFPSAWRGFLAKNIRQYSYLDAAKQALVRDVARVVVAEKDWCGCDGLSVTDEMKVTIAAQVALLVVGFEEPYFFDHVQSIILHPGRYTRPRQLQRYLESPGGAVYAGEAWYHSPIVLSWQDVLDAGRNASNGGNVTLHEFAHYLDGLDGEVSGAPPLAGRERERTWYRVTEAEYRRLVGAARRNEVTLLHQYGATNRPEFFAVATECFFERPQAMQRRHEALYAVLRDFYRQDPAQCWPDADVSLPSANEDIIEASREMDAASLQSNNPDALFTFAVICLHDGRYDVAEEAASRAIALDPTDAEAYQCRAAARIKLGRYGASLEDCNRAIQLDDSDSDVYRTRGAAYVKLRQYELAKNDVDRVLQESKDDAEACRIRGSAWIGLNQYRRALSDLSISIARDPLCAEAYYQRALAYRGLGRTEDADDDLERARQLDPEVEQR